jgi:hypothetical protein
VHRFVTGQFRQLASGGWNVKYFWMCALVMFVALQTVGYAAPRKVKKTTSPKVNAKFMQVLRKAAKDKPAGGNSFEVFVTPTPGGRNAVERLIGNLRDEGYFISVEEVNPKTGLMDITGDPTPLMMLAKCASVQFMAEKAAI